jgi:hypothetical protein
MFLFGKIEGVSTGIGQNGRMGGERQKFLLFCGVLAGWSWALRFECFVGAKMVAQPGVESVFMMFFL